MAGDLNILLEHVHLLADKDHIIEHMVSRSDLAISVRDTDVTINLLAATATSAESTFAGDQKEKN